MLTVQNDWIEYEETAAVRMTAAVPARRVTVRGGAACAQRLPVVSTRSARPEVHVRPAPISRPIAHRAAGSGGRAPAARLRLTRRGRFVLIVMPALLALSGGLLALSAPGTAQAAPTASVTPRTIVVGSGESLWTIAERIAPRTDPRATVAALEAANSLRTETLASGSVLVLPAGR